jgi:hypothetical protein
MTYSDAAKAYAKSRAHSTHRLGCICQYCENDCLAYDAGHAAALATVAPVQPRVLTTVAKTRALLSRQVVLSVEGDAWQRSFVGEDSWYLADDDVDVKHHVLTSERLVHDHGPLTLLAPVPATTEPVVTDDDEWFETLVQTERAHQITKGYTLAHDAEHGVGHLIEHALKYVRTNPVKTAAMLRAARDLVASQATTEPVRLTADDPRWRDGAKVRGEWEDGSAVEGILAKSRTSGEWLVLYLEACTTWTSRFTAVFLLAEAPDPDAELVEAFRGEFDGLTTEQDFREVVHLLRISGYEITKAEK